MRVTIPGACAFAQARENRSGAARALGSRAVVRRRARRATLLVALTATSAAACDPAGATRPPPSADLNVLFVGNSLTYANDLPRMVGHLIETYGSVGSVQVETLAFADFGLEDHWNEGSARARIASGGWDVVVIQQGPSATEGRPSLIEYAGRFADEVTDRGGRLAVYMVWPSSARAFDFDGVSESHRLAAEQSGSLLFPAGEAWRAVWALDADLPLYGPDGFHPSLMGSYLAALVMVQQLAGIDPADLPDGIVTPDGVLPLADGVSDRLHAAAAKANEDFAIS